MEEYLAAEQQESAEEKKGKKSKSKSTGPPDPCVVTDAVAQELSSLPADAASLISSMASAPPEALLNAAFEQDPNEALEAYINAVPAKDTAIGEGNSYHADNIYLNRLLFAIVSYQHSEFLRMVLSDERGWCCVRACRGKEGVRAFCSW